MEQKKHEGAGFLLKHADKYILFERVKSKADFDKDPTPEVEYAGGKVDGDQETPQQTAFAELVEELGTNILKDNWREHVRPLVSEAPSGKTIWVFLYELNADEFARLSNIDFSTWKADEYRDLAHLTGRASSAKCRKSLANAFTVSRTSMNTLLNAFRATSKSMKDAKDLRQVCKLECQLLNSSETRHFGLRAFNTILFEKFAENGI